MLREEIERQRDAATYRRLHEAGRTEEARRDLARLAIIRQQREEAARKKEAERKGLLMPSNEFDHSVSCTYETWTFLYHCSTRSKGKEEKIGHCCTIDSSTPHNLLWLWNSSDEMNCACSKSSREVINDEQVWREVNQLSWSHVLVRSEGGYSLICRFVEVQTAGSFID